MILISLFLLTTIFEICVIDKVVDDNDVYFFVSNDADVCVSIDKAVDVCFFKQ